MRQSSLSRKYFSQIICSLSNTWWVIKPCDKLIQGCKLGCICWENQLLSVQHILPFMSLTNPKEWSSQEFDTSDIIWLIKIFLTIVLQLLVQSLIVNCHHYIPIMRVSKLYTWCLSLMLLPFLIDVVATSHWHRCHF